MTNYKVSMNKDTEKKCDSEKAIQVEIHQYIE
jgi:hypothetical protein